MFENAEPHERGPIVSSGDVWVHDARLRPSLTLETEMEFGPEDDRTIRRVRISLEEPPPAVATAALERFWKQVEVDEDED